MQNATLIPVKYVGKRDSYADGTYGTRIVWAKGETQLVPADKAELMLRHPDVYVKGETTKDTSVAKVEEPKKKDKKESEEDQAQELRDAVQAMNKAALQQYAKTNFQIDLDKSKPVAALRSEVIGLIDQYGAP